MCLVNAVDGDTVSLRASQIAGAEKGQSELSDTCRSGRSETTVTQELLQPPDELISGDRLVTTRKLETKL
jgi:hypothetical protein